MATFEVRPRPGGGYEILRRDAGNPAGSIVGSYRTAESGRVHHAFALVELHEAGLAAAEAAKLRVSLAEILWQIAQWESGDEKPVCAACQNIVGAVHGTDCHIARARAIAEAALEGGE